MKKILMCLMMSAAFLGQAYALMPNPVSVTNAWVPVLPPTQKTTAAYMVITNNSPNQITLVSVTTPVAGAAEIHQMSDMNGMMNMGMVSELHIPPQGKVELKPGGFHIMLINLKKPLNNGDLVPLTLHFEDGSTLDVSAQVKIQNEDTSTAFNYSLGALPYSRV